MKFNQKSLIYKNTTLYDIDFYQKIRIIAIKYLNLQRRIEKQLNWLIKKTIAETSFIKMMTPQIFDLKENFENDWPNQNNIVGYNLIWY